MKGTPVSDQALRLGVAGLGRAFALMLPTFASDGRVTLVACADPREDARSKFAAEFDARAYPGVAELCEDRAVDAVYVATPHQYHAEHTEIAARAGKHILVEKPMALRLDEGRRIIDAVRRARVRLVVGHSHSFDPPVQRARALLTSGIYGQARMIHAFNYTDFLYRPRRPEELTTRLGGGVIFNQAAHQVDVMRLLGGGLALGVSTPMNSANGSVNRVLLKIHRPTAPHDGCCAKRQGETKKLRSRRRRATAATCMSRYRWARPRMHISGSSSYHVTRQTCA